eukprot:4019416-Prymnesium_polylepis.1
MARCRRPTSLALSSSSCLGTDALAACQPYLVSENFPIIVIIVLCEESRRIRVSRIRCYSFRPRPVARMARGTGQVRRGVVPL